MPGWPTKDPSVFNLHGQALGSEVIVIASGELDLAAVPAIQSLFGEVVTPACEQVIVDASGVQFIDCAGLHALLAGANGAQVVLRSPSRVVQRLLELTDLAELVEVGPPLGPSQEHVA